MSSSFRWDSSTPWYLKVVVISVLREGVVQSSGFQAAETDFSRPGRSWRAIDVTQKIAVVPIVIRFVIASGSQYQANCAGREVIELPPYHRSDVQALIRAIEV